MAKFLNEVLNKGSEHTVTKKAADLGSYTPKSGDEEKFVKQHDIEVHTFTDPAIHNSAKKIKPVLTRPEEKRHKDAVKPSFKGASNGVTEAKETDTPACNNTAGGVSCPVHGIKECSTGTMKEEELDELSTDLLHRAAHKAAKVAMTDVQGRSGPIFKKRAAQANKFRAKGMEQEKKERAMKEEALDELSPATMKSYVKKAGADKRDSEMKSKVYSKLANTLDSQSPKDASDVRAQGHGHYVNAKKRGEGIKLAKKKLGEEAIDEVSKKTLGSYIQGASRDALSKQYALGKGEKTDTRKLMNRRKGIDKAADKLSKEEVELDEMPTQHRSTAGMGSKRGWASSKANKIKNQTLKNYRKPGEPSKEDKVKLADLAKNSGVEVKKLKPGKAKGIKEDIEEGAKVDRMVSHIKSSEKAAGKSDKKAESIAWATANKRGMLTKESAPVPPKPLDAKQIAVKFKSFVTGGGSTKTLSHYNTHVKLLSKHTGVHPDHINKQIRKHVKSMEESDTPITFPNKTSDNAVGQNI
jgi:hypothetical protein